MDERISHTLYETCRLLLGTGTWPDRLQKSVDAMARAWDGQARIVLDGETYERGRALAATERVRRTLWAGDRSVGYVEMSCAPTEQAGDETETLLSQVGGLLELAWQREQGIPDAGRAQLMQRDEALVAIARAISAAEYDIRTISNTITRQSAEVLGDASVLVLSDDAQSLQPVSFHHRNDAACALMREIFEQAQPVSCNQTLERVRARTGPVFIRELTPERARQLLSPAYTEYIAEIGVSSLLIVPLQARGELIGALGVARDRGSHPFESADQQFLQDVADLAALSIRNARLFEQLQQSAVALESRVEQRTAQLSTANARLQEEIEVREQAEQAQRAQRALAEALSGSAAVLNKTLDLDAVLDRILVHMENVVPHDISAIMLVDDDVGRLVRLRRQTHGPTYGTQGEGQAEVPITSILRHMAETGEAVSIADVAAESDWVNLPGLEAIAAYAGAPMRQDAHVVGFLHLGSKEPDFFRPEHVAWLDAFADHASIAVRNARLYQQAQELAILQERQRLARELHDSVVQTLWSANLIADVLPTLWQQDPKRAEQRLHRLRRLAQSALAEMRTLLVELRPQTMQQASLAELIEQLAAAAVSRTRADVQIDSDQSCVLPAAVKHALYRIVQEALNNVIRHAQATTIQLELHCDEDQVLLRVSDDGRGFDVDRVGPGHFGLDIMRERAAEIGATIQVASKSGEGTIVSVVWSANQGVAA
jgi:signal transduction histidine kinase